VGGPRAGDTGGGSSGSPLGPAEQARHPSPRRETQPRRDPYLHGEQSRGRSTAEQNSLPALVGAENARNGKDQWLAANGLAITLDDARESIASLGSGLLSLKAEPPTDHCRNRIHLLRRQHAKTAD